MTEPYRYTGHLRKMVGTLPASGETVHYDLPLDERRLPISEWLGHNLSIASTGEIHCIACGRLTKKSYQRGYCFPCMRRLAECDICIVRPERCHYDQGTCREPEWGRAHCMQPHIVYLANSSGLKVGITRHTQVPTRWIDQGATQALPIFQVQTRYQAGLLEVVLAAHVADKTDWRRMLKGDPVAIDLAAERERLLAACGEEIEAVRSRVRDDAVRLPPDAQVTTVAYPVRRHPQRVRSLDLDKTPTIEGRLDGIKGQYLILDCGVINARKFAGYRVEIDVEHQDE